MSTHDKKEFLMNVRNTLTQLDKLRDVSDEMYKMYFARGYNSGGINEITQTDIDDNPELSPMLVADLTSFVTLGEDIDKFLGNQAVLTGDRDTLIAKLRYTPL